MWRCLCSLCLNALDNLTYRSNSVEMIVHRFHACFSVLWFVPDINCHPTIGRNFMSSLLSIPLCHWLEILLPWLLLPVSQLVCFSLDVCSSTASCVEKVKHLSPKEEENWSRLRHGVWCKLLGRIIRRCMKMILRAKRSQVLRNQRGRGSRRMKKLLGWFGMFLVAKSVVSVVHDVLIGTHQPPSAPPPPPQPRHDIANIQMNHIHKFTTKSVHACSKSDYLVGWERMLDCFFVFF